jgi:hypothetical protein
MKLLITLVASCIAGTAYARPAVVIKETSRIVLNASVIDGYPINGPIAAEGDDAIIVGARSAVEDDYVVTYTAAFLFRRTGAAWVFVRKLAEGSYSTVDDYRPSPRVAMKDGIAVSTTTFPRLFERQPNGEWVPATIAAGSQQGENPVTDIDIDQGRVFIGSGSWGGTVYERDSAGSWHGRFLAGDYSGNADNGSGGPVTLSGPWAAVHSEYNGDGLSEPGITLFNNNGQFSWTQTQRLAPLAGHTFGDIALRGDELFVVDAPGQGLARFGRGPDSQWYLANQLRTPGDPMADFYAAYSDTLKKGDGFILHGTRDHDRGGSVLRVFQPNNALFEQYEHVATLIDSRGGSIGGAVVNGRRVIAGTTGGWLIFDLPAAFAGKELRQETFETGNGAGWTQLAGSQWSVAQSGDSRVFRQSSTVGDAGASFDATNWANQSVQADVKPTAFNGADRWVGLATRRSDASNYYYVTLRSSGIVALKRNRDGVFSNLASASFPVALNRTYRVRLESFGANHRVFIDGVRVLEANDTGLIAGHPALLTYRASADFDNVLVSPSWATTIYTAADGPAFSTPEDGAQPAPWKYSGTGQWYWQYEGANNLFRQTSNTGDARAAIDPGINQLVDQIVEARVRIKSFGAGNGEKWVGLMANYREPENFLYMSLRSSNVLTLRRVEGNRVRQIGAVVLPVALDTWYQLRLDAVGDRVRAYVNGKLLIEAVEPQPQAGNGGMVTYKAAADFDDFRETQP